jgi:hypothetical protein
LASVRLKDGSAARARLRNSALAGVSASGREAERGLAGGEDPQPGRGREQLAHQGNRVADVLEVVEHEQDLPRLQVLGDRPDGTELGLAGSGQGFGDRGRNGGAVGDGGQGDQERAVRELLEELIAGGDGQPRLARSTRPDQRDQPLTRPCQSLHQISQLGVTSHQWG